MLSSRGVAQVESPSSPSPLSLSHVDVVVVSVDVVAVVSVEAVVVSSGSVVTSSGRSPSSSMSEMAPCASRPTSGATFALPWRWVAALDPSAAAPPKPSRKSAALNRIGIFFMRCGSFEIEYVLRDSSDARRRTDRKPCRISLARGRASLRDSLEGVAETHEERLQRERYVRVELDEEAP